MSRFSREGQVWRDISDGEWVLLYCYGAPYQDELGDWKQGVVLLDLGRADEWSSHSWENDSCMTRVL